MLQLYLMYVKSILRKKAFYLWNLLFPLVFSIVLFVIVNNLGNVEQFHTISVGFVAKDKGMEYEQLLEVLMKKRSINGMMVFQVKECALEEGMALFNEEKVDGLIVLEDGIKLHMNQNGMNQSILKSYLEQYQQLVSINFSENKENGETISWDIIRDVILSDTFIEQEMEKVAWDNSMLYFFTLIGMSCLLTLELGFILGDYVLPNQSVLAARLRCSCISRYKYFIAGLFASFTMAFCALVILMLFIRYGLGYDIPLDNSLIWSILIFGILFGILFGYIICAFLKEKRHWKNTIAMAIITIFSFLAGIVRMDVKYYIKQNYEIFTYINPVNLISDAFYHLLYLKSYSMLIQDAFILFFIVILTLLGALILTGRRAYDHI